MRGGGARCEVYHHGIGKSGICRRYLHSFSSAWCMIAKPTPTPELQAVGRTAGLIKHRVVPRFVPGFSSAHDIMAPVQDKSCMRKDLSVRDFCIK